MGAVDVLARLGAVAENLKEVEADVEVLVKDVAEIRGRLSQMPTTFQMLTWFVGVALGLVGLVFAVAWSVGTH
jgi:hypothetical protein